MQQPVRPPPVVVLRAVSWEFGRGIAREVGGNLPPGERRGGRKEGQPDLRGFTCAEMSGKSRRSGRPPFFPPFFPAASSPMPARLGGKLPIMRLCRQFGRCLED
jgi:hypothetical protein